MADHAFQRAGSVLSNEEVFYVCRALKSDQLMLLCLRECKVRDKDLERILKHIGSCKSLHQLTLNVNMVTRMHHVEILAQCIKMNKSLTGLHVHGSDLGDVGMQVLGRALSVHPGIVSLDVGDCKLSDMSIDVLYSLMLPVSSRPGITELTLSDNPRISALGWAQFSMGLANCNTLRWLFLDYNLLGDYGASCVLVAMSASQSVEIVDLEGCGLTEHTGQVILHLVQNHLGGLSRVKLSNNRIQRSTVEAIKKHVSENHLDDTESVFTVTTDDLFSLNTSRLPSSLKTSTRLYKSSSSSDTKSSSSNSEKYSGDYKHFKEHETTEFGEENPDNQMQKQYKDRNKKQFGGKTEIRRNIKDNEAEVGNVEGMKKTKVKKVMRVITRKRNQKKREINKTYVKRQLQTKKRKKHQKMEKERPSY